MAAIARDCILERTLMVSEVELTQEFEAELIRQGLLGGLCHLLIKQGSATPKVLAWARQHYREQFFQAASFHALLEKLNQELAIRGVRVILLKGAHLSLTHYPVLGTRHLSDIDVYLPVKSSLADVQAALSACGLKPPQSLGTWQDDLGRQIDLHVPEDEIVEARVMSLERAAERSLPLAGYSHLNGLQEEDLAAYVSLHALKHGFCKLAWIWDIHRLNLTPSNQVLPTRASAYVLYVLNQEFGLGGAVPTLSWWERKMLRRVVQYPYSGLGQMMLSLAMKTRTQTLIFLARSALFDNFGNRKTFNLKGLRAKIRNIMTALRG
ncbi:nucleotidyltransferase family protein [bacterium]|nr:nucleotidyltransferase family protein [bacterium]